MNIIKASAGSGKTFRLSEDVVNLLVNSKDPLEYRQILAVTFTNKATAEMKARILEKLKERPGRAQDILIDILHDYNAFSVSTIDRFFQRTLKAFAREMSQSANYQIDLDRNALIAEAMDRILDSLTEENKPLMEWVRGSVREMMEQGNRVDLEKNFHKIGEQLKNEEHRALADKLGIDDTKAYDKDRLADIRGECNRVRDSFHDAVAKAACALVGTVKGKNAILQLEDFTRKRASWEQVPPLKASLRKEIGGTALEALMDRPFKEYNTVRLIGNMIFTLGLAGEFYREFDALLKEKNVMCLDESNTLLKKIIDGSDAPFVYEKLGVRYRHFLLDEFQDTSRIQWDNFLPLLKESESKPGGMNLIVGDVKQSIYRWRNSDWKLLGEEVQNAFPDGKPESPDNNWRTCRGIVDFNGRFFEDAASKLGESLIYDNVRQKAMLKDAQRGILKVSFCEDQLHQMLDSVRFAIQNNARPGDIAILVRGHKEGAAAAAALIGNGYTVISDDSLRVKSSPTVSRLVVALKKFDNPHDDTANFLSASTDFSYPENYHSLIDLCEELLRQIQEENREAFAANTLYIQSFMDELRKWSEVNGNNLAGFLKAWDEKDPCIGSPEDAAAIRILTIHKSKGLEFPYVIFPFADKVELFKRCDKWCALSTEGTSLSKVFDGIYPVNLSASTADTLFADALLEEKRQQKIDALNLFYVALTRAVCGMHVIAAPPSKKFVESLGKGKAEYSDMSQLLYDYLGACSSYSEGSYDFSLRAERPGTASVDIPSSYLSYPIGDRLKPSADASDFFGEDGRAITRASTRLWGIALHDILSGVNRAEDLDAAVLSAIGSGILDKDEAAQAKELLAERIAAHPEWFDGNGFNETGIIGPDGKEHRPDRVIERGGTITVIDYKFGEEDPRYFKQVRGYMELYRKMGWSDVQGAIWYVPDDKVAPVR